MASRRSSSAAASMRSYQPVAITAALAITITANGRTRDSRSPAGPGETIGVRSAGTSMSAGLDEGWGSRAARLLYIGAPAVAEPLHRHLRGCERRFERRGTGPAGAGGSPN